LYTEYEFVGVSFEADLLVCAYGTRMQIVSFISDPRIVDRILRHRESARRRTQDPLGSRAPPDPRTRPRQ
jgi:hypothetical protein